MGQFEVIVNQIIILAILVIIGYLGARWKVINDEVKSSMAKIIIKISMPLLVLTSISSKELTDEMMKNALAVAGFAYLSLGLLLAAGFLSAKLMGMKGVTKNVHTAHIVFGNVVFLGFPLLNALYPDGQGLLYAAIYQIVSDSLLWTVGVYLLSKHEDVKKGKGLRQLINPNTIAFVIGIIMMVFKLRLPGLLQQPLSQLGNVTVPLSMLFIGATLASIPLTNIYKRYTIFVLSILKMIIIPVIVLYILNYVNRYLNFGINDIAKAVLVLETAMPGMATVVVLAKDFDSDYVYAAECVFITTILSLITLPFMFYLIEIIK